MNILPLLRTLTVGILACLAAIGLLTPSAAAAAPAGGAQTPSPLAALMNETGLQYALVDDDLAQVVFDGSNVPQIVLHVGIGGDGPLRCVWVYSKIAAVRDQRDWPAEIFPWLLSRNTTLARGSFGLSDDGCSILYADKLTLDGLTGKALGNALQFAGLITDDTYPQVMTYLGK